MYIGYDHWATGVNSVKLNDLAFVATKNLNKELLILLPTQKLSEVLSDVSTSSGCSYYHCFRKFKVALNEKIRKII